MELYLVYDLKGGGRPVGVFDDRDLAKALADQYPAYYKLHVANLNELNPDTLAWTDSQEQTDFLCDIIAQFN